jgi:hypothetical protein
VTITLPQALPAASGWQLYDWLDRAKQTAAAVAGSAIQVDFGQLDITELWLIDRAVIQCDSLADTKLRLYTTNVAPMNLLSGSDSDAATGNFDEAEYPRGLLVRPGDSLVAVWTGATTGAKGTIRLQAQIWRRPA